MAHAFFEDTQEMQCVFINTVARDPSIDCRQLFDDLIRIDSGRPVSRECAGRVWREVKRVRLERARAARRRVGRRERAPDLLALPLDAAQAELASARQIDGALRELRALHLARMHASDPEMPSALQALACLLRRTLAAIRGDGRGPGAPTPPSPLPGARIPVSRRPVKAGPFPRPFAGSER